MIKFENTEVMNFEGAFRGMRNPLNSWDKGDSILCPKNPTGGDCKDRADIDSPCPRKTFDNEIFCIGPNDLALAQRLIKAGSDHRKFLRQIFVSVDITAPLYWWKEFDTYKVATVANSCSTMHKIADKEFHFGDFSFEHLFAGDEPGLDITIEDCRTGFSLDHHIASRKLLHLLIELLNVYRRKYLETKDKTYWWQMIQLLPSSYNQKRTVTLSYETLRNIYSARRNHKLDEWRVGFMEWIDSLPYAEELIKYE